MNQRIRALAKEAGLWRQHYDIGEESPERLEKFAELIVRECAEQVMIYQLHNNRTGEMVPFIVEDIKLHFGVEE